VVCHSSYNTTRMQSEFKQVNCLNMFSTLHKRIRHKKSVVIATLFLINLQVQLSITCRWTSTSNITNEKIDCAGSGPAGIIALCVPYSTLRGTRVSWRWTIIGKTPFYSVSQIVVYRSNKTFNF